MKHTLIQSNGTVRVFFVAEVATLYQRIYGGTIVQGVLHESQTETA